ncbi:MAG: helix-turn-helix domain-containing protein [Acidimicrobiales bacterium]
MTAMTIGRALATRRRDTGLDQEAAAARLGVTRSTYASYERGTRRPSAEGLRAVADFLDVAIDAVLDLYGATCVEQARRVLEPDSHDNGSTTSPSRGRARHHDVAVIERVYFEAAGSNGAPDDSAPALTSATSAVEVARGREDRDAWSSREAIGHEQRRHPAETVAGTSGGGNRSTGRVGKGGKGKGGKGKGGKGKGSEEQGRGGESATKREKKGKSKGPKKGSSIVRRAGSKEGPRGRTSAAKDASRPKGERGAKKSKKKKKRKSHR